MMSLRFSLHCVSCFSSPVYLAVLFGVLPEMYFGFEFYWEMVSQHGSVLIISSVRQ